MKANELRIGNYFHPCNTKGGITLPSTDIVWRVGSIDKFGKVGVIEPQEHDNIYLPISECAEIPLTEEWLLKFGFVSNELSVQPNVFVYHSGGIYIRGMSGAVHPRDVHYVHQLQNLYYALTGEELTNTEEV